MKISMINLIIELLMMITIMMIILIMTNYKISPINFMATLFIFTSIMMMITYLISMKSLYCYMIFISMISGNMIMFLYFTSLINNYYNSLSKITIFTIILCPLTILMIMFKYNKSNICNQEFTGQYNMNLLYKIFLYPMNSMTILIILFLMLTLLFVTKICLTHYKPLRKIKN